MIEFEAISRSLTTPRKFYNYCKKRLGEENTKIYLGSYEEWANPPTIENLKTSTDTLVQNYYEAHSWSEGDYNIILEFDFWDEKIGFGYCYVMDNNA